MVWSKIKRSLHVQTEKYAQGKGGKRNTNTEKYLFNRTI